MAQGDGPLWEKGMPQTTMFSVYGSSHVRDLWRDDKEDQCRTDPADRLYQDGHVRYPKILSLPFL
ncbi:MAG: hypothetical protein IPP42_11855 [Saprospiraceae bacterium]|nr:hypothetical protein [Saprospiraceae bacterium]